jgi:hypothetical protein
VGESGDYEERTYTRKDMRRFLTVVMVGMIGAIALPQIVAKEATIAQAQAINSPWKLTAGAKQFVGRKVQTKDIVGEVQTHEAAGQWLAVTLNIRNSSGTRQKSKDVFALGTAKLIDTAGRVYEVDADAAPQVYGDILDKAPFGAGETRSVRLLFDVPANVKIRQLTVLGDDVKGETQEFKVGL